MSAVAKPEPVEQVRNAFDSLQEAFANWVLNEGRAEEMALSVPGVMEMAGDLTTALRALIDEVEEHNQAFGLFDSDALFKARAAVLAAGDW